MIWSVDALLAVSGDHENLILVYSPMGIGSSCDCAEIFSHVLSFDGWHGRLHFRIDRAKRIVHQSAFCDFTDLRLIGACSLAPLAVSQLGLRCFSV